MTRFDLYFYGLAVPSILLWQNVIDEIYTTGTAFGIYGFSVIGFALLYVYHIDTREEE
jgi:hypothetical protein